jgi:DNA-binding NarL/FixJ family response regulator
MGSRRRIRNMTMQRRTEYGQEVSRFMGKVETAALQETRPGLSSTGVTTVGQRILSELSTEELSVVRLLLEEGTNRAIADRMGTSVQTVKNHLLRIFQKVGVDDRLSLAIALIRHGVVACPCGTKPRLPLAEPLASYALERPSRNS